MIFEIHRAGVGDQVPVIFTARFSSVKHSMFVMSPFLLLFLLGCEACDMFVVCTSVCLFMDSYAHMEVKEGCHVSCSVILCLVSLRLGLSLGL